jgi:hypothetical protein
MTEEEIEARIRLRFSCLPPETKRCDFPSAIADSPSLAVFDSDSSEKAFCDYVVKSVSNTATVENLSNELLTSALISRRKNAWLKSCGYLSSSLNTLKVVDGSEQQQWKENSKQEAEAKKVNEGFNMVLTIHDVKRMIRESRHRDAFLGGGGGGSGSSF